MSLSYYILCSDTVSDQDLSSTLRKDDLHEKLIPLCLSVLLLVGLTACSGSSEENRATTATSGSESAAQESAGESNAAVIYFSVTGNTEQVAQTFADKTGAALFEIEPEEPYTDADLDYNNDSCRANQEQNDPNARPAIAGDALDLSGYDTIYLGYPIWLAYHKLIQCTQLA